MSTTTKPKTLEKSRYSCSICFEEYDKSIKIKTLSCEHDLCLTCFKKHSDVSNDCPFCRKDIYKPLVTKRKAYQKTCLNLKNSINSTQLIKSLCRHYPLDDTERDTLKTLFGQLKQNIIDLGLIIDDSFPVSNILNFNNIYLGENILVNENTDDDNDNDNDDDNLNTNLTEIFQEWSAGGSGAERFVNELMSIYFSSTNTQNNG